MWYQQDGCPVHSVRIITELLKIIGLVGQEINNRWATRFPDLTPMDFYLWGKLKQ